MIKIINEYHMRTQTLVTIPKSITRMGDLVILSRKEFEKLLDKKDEELKEKELLRLSQEAKNLKKDNKLPILRSLRDLR
ncbi:TPA: hypothetical protein DCX62_01670 [Candidatus Azambacteria bacterium]|nr:MAG: hypothetical protein UU33_C0001G0532 [Candidatus Azambacteria bacterium GW2011_GWF1_41_10]KKS49565.1 MAG: hypothetical protein UV14_C0001G0311 [Candidatus Azambacteria bacterium GW2011_GWF2_42_22]KKT03676.1 MAG: hypothetical protein UV81_C0001G0272 [Candidatus Azambacteria bacterium GW2011_GWD1_43_18]KKT12830.1 MAG: hypothetical protein UV93_C0001G0131 [Candidatus Azambacteria bacterium GW2011_GWC2_43_27]OGD41460.1 MAG: hypothetical protein A3K28_02985 [Candidatus Azambacteria bacterium